MVAASVPEGRQPRTSKFVFKKKLNAEGKVCKYKVRLVVQGYKQRYGFDFDDTYEPVVDYESAQAVLSHFVGRRARIDMVDFVTAFLNGYVDEVVYITLPSG